MNIVALICARGGSKGLPGKNIRPLGGKPLIAWSIDSARSVNRINRVMVSTDDDDIAQAARAAGADVPFMRPAELAQDNSPEWAVWRHALTFLEQDMREPVDALVVVPATAPLRALGDIERCIDEYLRGDVDVVITVSAAHRNPYFNMVKKRPDETVCPVIEPDATVSRRQDAPEVYDMTTVAYVARPEFVMTRDAMFDGRVRSVEVPVERAIDIDTLLDFKIAEALL